MTRENKEEKRPYSLSGRQGVWVCEQVLDSDQYLLDVDARLPVLVCVYQRQTNPTTKDRGGSQHSGAARQSATVPWIHVGVKETRRETASWWLFWRYPDSKKQTLARTVSGYSSVNSSVMAYVAPSGSSHAVPLGPGIPHVHLVEQWGLRWAQRARKREK